MSTKRLLSALIMLFAVFCVAVAQQPYGGCWHPDNIKDWSPEKDPDAKFNRAQYLCNHDSWIPPSKQMPTSMQKEKLQLV